MADNQIVKIDFQFDLGNVPASSKAFSNYLKSIGVDLKFTKASTDALATSVGHLATEQTKAAQAGAAAANSVKKSNMQYTNLALVLQDLPYGFRGIQNNLPALIGGMAGMTGAFYLAASAAIALYTAYDMGAFKSKEATQKAKERTEALQKEKDAIDSIYKSTASETVEVTSLIAVLKSETETRGRKLDALAQLKKISPEIFNSLVLEKNAVIGLDYAYENYIKNLGTIIAVKTKQAELEAIIEKRLKAEGVTLSQEEKDIKATGEALNANITAKQTDYEQRLKNTRAQIKESKSQREINKLKDQETKILLNLQQLSSGIKVQNADTKTGKTPKELAEEKARLMRIANDAETDAYIQTLDERAQKEYKVGLELANGLEKMRAAGYTNSETYYAGYRQNMLNIAKEYDDKAAKEQERRDKEAADAANKINDRNLQNALTALKIESDVATKIANASGKTTSTDRIKILDDYKSKLYELASVGGYTAEQFDKISDALVNVDAAIAGSKDKVKSFNVTWIDTINGINSTINDFINNSLYALGESIGKVLAGENVDAIDVFGTLIADALQSLGKQLIAFGVAKLAAWEALKNPTPAGAALAVAAGIAAVAAGAALKSSLTNAKSTESNFSRGKNSNMPRKFADGGIISGPTYGLMGEYPGAKSNPEVVAPLDKLKDMIGGGGGGTFMLRGQDLLLSVNRAQKASNLKGQNISLA